MVGVADRKTSSVCHGFQVCQLVCLCNSNPAMLWSLNLHCNPSEPLPHLILPKMFQQSDHLSLYYLNTCKKICLNFPLCFWSGLPPFYSVAPMRRWSSPKQQLLSLSVGSWALTSRHALCPCQESVPVHTPLAPNTCRDPVSALFRGPCAKPTQGSSRDTQKNISLSFLSLKPNIHLVRTRRGWNKETFGVGQWFVIVSITTVYSSLLLKCLTFYFLFLNYSRRLQCVIFVWLYHT